MTGEERRFLSEKIDMKEISAGGDPVRFRWRSRDYYIIKIVRSWQDWGHPEGTHKKSWMNRRHRNYYEIKTDSKFHGLIYFDRGVKPSSPRQWVLLEEYK
jgi:hypothetical protein